MISCLHSAIKPAPTTAFCTDHHLPTKNKSHQNPSYFVYINMGDLSSPSPKHKNDYVAVDIPQAVMHRVPTQVRGAKNSLGHLQVAEGRNNQIYDPVLVSLGPYHYGQPQLKQVEALKPEILRLLISDGRHQQQILKEIRSRSREIRIFYGGLSKDKFDDDVLAEMMLHDACFLLYCMKKMAAQDDDDDDCLLLDLLGMSRLEFVVRDFFMWENQLPFFLLKMLIPLTFNHVSDKTADAFFYDLVSSIINCGDSCNKKLPQIPQGKPIVHLLDACRTTLVEKKESTAVETVAAAAVNSQFRSVTDLKAKGIHFRPTKSKSYCLKDISFKSHSFYGMLRLPILLLDNKTNVIFSNMIAMEMSPGSGTDFAVTSYVKFMKSLIMKAEDVQELREKGIVVSCLLANDEEVVKMFREMKTEGSCRKDMFRGVRERINEHCRSKTKTFKAELVYTYFRSPWTAIALFAAILLLCINCLNFLLNYYKFRHPVNRA